MGPALPGCRHPLLAQIPGLDISQTHRLEGSLPGPLSQLPRCSRARIRAADAVFLRSAVKALRAPGWEKSWLVPRQPLPSGSANLVGKKRTSAYAVPFFLEGSEKMIPLVQQAGLQANPLPVPSGYKLSKSVKHPDTRSKVLQPSGKAKDISSF